MIHDMITNLDIHIQSLLFLPALSLHAKLS